jgi:hypothetical protein
MTISNDLTKHPSGLCPTCDLVSDCRLVHGGDGPVWYCEEYLATPRGSSPRLDNLIGHGHLGCSAAPPNWLGLCCNCEGLPDCGLAKPEAGVWYCEEYR